MGSCCFTPRRSQFLWWYWLLLASIVGIPMLIACWYVARQAKAGQGADPTLGKTARFIFWSGAVLSACVLIGVLHALIAHFQPEWMNLDGDRVTETYFSPGYLWALVASYLGSVAVLAGAYDPHATRGGITSSSLLALALLVLIPMLWGVHPGLLIGLVIGVLCVPIGMSIEARHSHLVGRSLIRIPIACLVLGLTVASGASVTEFFWLLGVCLLPAHAFSRFTARPNPRTARVALAMFVASAFLFWGAVKYSRVANLWLHGAVRGKSPDSATVKYNMSDSGW